MQVGVIAILIGTGSGTLIGLITGYKGGKIDFILQRVMDTILCFPPIILALLIVVLLGKSMVNLMIAIELCNYALRR